MSKRRILALLIFAVIALIGLNAKIVTVNYNMNIDNVAPYSIPWDTSQTYPVYDMSSPPYRIFLGLFDGKELHEPGTVIKIKEDTTLTGMWEIPTATVTFDYGYSNSPTAIQREVSFDTELDFPPLPTRNGYIFCYWTDEQGNKYDSNDTIWIGLENKQFTAIWEKNPTITLNYGFDNITHIIDIVYGEDFSIPSDIPQRQGYDFSNWTDSKTGSRYTPGRKIYNIEEDIILNAEWEAKTYSVKLTLNQGKEDQNSIIKSEYGKTINLPYPLHHNGWIFEGWTDGNTIYKAGDDFVVSGNITLTAEWKEDLSVEQEISEILAAYQIPEASIPNTTTDKSESTEGIKETISYLLTIVDQNIKVDDYLEAYNILIGLIENPISYKNDEVVKAYNDFLVKYGNNPKAKQAIMDESYIPFKHWNDRYGYKDQNGNIIIEPQFADAGEFHEGLAPVLTFPEKNLCFINMNGEIVIKPEHEYRFEDGKYIAYPGSSYSVEGNYNEGVCLIYLAGKGYTYIDRNGTINYEFLNNAEINSADVKGQYFSEGLIPAQNANGYWGYLNKEGNWAISPQFKFASAFQDGYALVVFGTGKVSLITKEGKPSQPIKDNPEGMFTFNDGVLSCILFPSHGAPAWGTYVGISLLNLSTNTVTGIYTYLFDVPSSKIVNEGFFPVINSQVNDESPRDSSTTFSIYDVFGNQKGSYKVKGLVSEYSLFDKGKITFRIYEDIYTMDYFGNVTQTGRLE